MTSRFRFQHLAPAISAWIRVWLFLTHPPKRNQHGFRYHVSHHYRCVRPIHGTMTILLGVILVNCAWAHDPGLSVVTGRVAGEVLSIHMAMARSDVERLVTLDTDHDGKVTETEFQAALPRMEAEARNVFKLTSEAGLLPISEATVQHDERDGIHFILTFHGASPGQLTIRSLLLDALPRGHRQFLSIRDQKGNCLGEQMLDVSHNALTAQLVKSEQAGTFQRSFREFLKLGVMHIATGYDHLLFLLGLLLVGGSFRSALQIITSFTCAHSITLALATLNVINIAPRIIEPLIAASIVYVGLENLLRPEVKGRWILTFGFGLIHGCGFAAALR
jgi:hypothetical protein